MEELLDYIHQWLKENVMIFTYSELYTGSPVVDIDKAMLCLRHDLKTAPIKKHKVMTRDQFIDLVARMRRNQKEFFKTHKKEYLDESKSLEKLVDREIENYEEESLF